jgi:hypothetical protein
MLGYFSGSSGTDEESSEEELELEDDSDSQTILSSLA